MAPGEIGRDASPRTSHPEAAVDHRLPRSVVSAQAVSGGLASPLVRGAGSAILVAVAITGCGGGGGRTTVTVNKTVTESSTASANLKTYRVPSQGMEPTLSLGTTITADLDAYKTTEPQRGDVIVFHPPLGAETAECGSAPQPGQVCMKGTASQANSVFVKRIVALPGDSVAIKRGRVYIGGALKDASKIKPDPSCGTCNLPTPATVPSGTYFVMGDNRGESADSREWGAVPKAWILGRVSAP